MIAPLTLIVGNKCWPVYGSRQMYALPGWKCYLLKTGWLKLSWMNMDVLGVKFNFNFFYQILCSWRKNAYYSTLSFLRSILFCRIMENINFALSWTKLKDLGNCSWSVTVVVFLLSLIGRSLIYLSNSGHL